MVEFEILGRLFDLSFILKILFLVLILAYTAFAAILFQQAKVMNGVVYHSSSQIVEMIAIAHMVAAFSLFLYALAIL